MQQIAHRSCEMSILGTVQNLTGHSLHNLLSLPCFEQGISTRASSQSLLCCDQKLSWTSNGQSDLSLLFPVSCPVDKERWSEPNRACTDNLQNYMLKCWTFLPAQYSFVCPVAITIQSWVLLPNIPVCSILYNGPLQSQVKFLCCFLLILAKRDSVPNLALFSAGGKSKL